MTDFLKTRMIERASGVEWGTETDVFFADATPDAGQTPASFLRGHGRALFGDAAGYPGNTVGSNGGDATWLEDVPTDGGSEWWLASARVGSVTSFGAAGSFAARVNPEASADRSVFGVRGLVYNSGLDSPHVAKAWAGYLEAHHAPAGGREPGLTALFEFQIANYDSAAVDPLLPHGTVPAGAHGGTIGSGIDTANTAVVYPVSWALRIEGTGGTFHSGIVFRSDALEPWSDSLRRAVLMQRNQTLSWFNNDGDEVGKIVSTTSNGPDAITINMGGAGIAFNNDAGFPFAFFNNGPNTEEVNYLSFTSHGTGTGPVLGAAGVDANIDLRLAPKGTGRVSFGSYDDGTTPTYAGTIEIRDASGTVRKLMVAA